MRIGDTLVYTGEGPEWDAPINWFTRQITGFVNQMDYVRTGRAGDLGTELWISREDIVNGKWLNVGQL